MNIKSVFQSFGGCLVAAALVAAGPLRAETLPVAGWYPAANDDATAVNVIKLDRFEGEKGLSLSFAVTDGLERAFVDGEQYFQIAPRPKGRFDAILSGSAGIEAFESEMDDKHVVRCEKWAKRDKKITKNSDRECLEESITYFECNELTVSFFPDVRLIAYDGDELFRFREKLAKTQHYCADTQFKPTVDSLAEEMVGEVASAVHRNFIPNYRSETIRIMESRKGMSRSEKALFREGVRLTNSDWLKSCDVFSSMEQNLPNNVSVLFNIGLCAESQGDIDRATDYYENALSVEPGKDYPISGLQRIAERRRADLQLDAHFGNSAIERMPLATAAVVH